MHLTKSKTPRESALLELAESSLKPIVFLDEPEKLRAAGRKLLEDATANYERHGQANAPAVNDYFWSEAEWERAAAKCSRIELEQLRLATNGGQRFELIVLDPPKFASNQHQVERAARAYKDINLGALRLLEPGGSLLTFSCSGAIDADLFQKIVAGAVIDAGVDCFLRARLAAGADHPILMTHPEGEYLKGLLLERL